MSRPQSITVPAPTTARGGAHDQLMSELRAAARGAAPGEIVAASLVIPVPRTSMPTVADTSWASGEHRAFACGQTAVLRAHGANRFADIERQATALFASMRGRARPRLFGGFSFDDRDLDGTVWSDFAGARFVLPRWQLLAGPGSAELVLTARVGALPTARELGVELERWLAACDDPAPAPRAASADTVESLELARQSAADAFRDRVQAITSAITSGGLEKVVTAWRDDIALPAAVDVPAVMHRLAQLYPDCFRFAITAGDSLLLGAPPELLVRVRGRAVASEALAGSIARDTRDAARRLLESNKDRAEHELVVRELESQLAGVCSALEIPTRPGIRSLRHLLHLRTAVRGTLSKDRHAVELVGRLHPTPAVGGTPRQQALDWLADNEDQPRGWYAAPVGWFDADGNGEFAVAIRTALVRGRRAHLYTGAGIVAGSDPDTELAETMLKQRAMLDTLGVHG